MADVTSMLIDILDGSTHKCNWSNGECQFARVHAREFLRHRPTGAEYQAYIREHKKPFLAWWALGKELFCRDCNYIKLAAEAMVDPTREHEREAIAMHLNRLYALMDGNDLLFNIE